MASYRVVIRCWTDIIASYCVVVSCWTNIIALYCAIVGCWTDIIASYHAVVSCWTNIMTIKEASAWTDWPKWEGAVHKELPAYAHNAAV